MSDADVTKCPWCGAAYSEPHRAGCALHAQRQARIEEQRKLSEERKAAWEKTTPGRIEKLGLASSFHFREGRRGYFNVFDRAGVMLATAYGREFVELIVEALNDAACREQP